jgi:hypothetical protein
MRHKIEVRYSGPRSRIWVQNCMEIRILYNATLTSSGLMLYYVTLYSTNLTKYDVCYL